MFPLLYARSFNQISVYNSPLFEWVFENEFLLFYLCILSFVNLNSILSNQIHCNKILNLVKINVSVSIPKPIWTVLSKELMAGHSDPKWTVDWPNIPSLGQLRPCHMAS